MMKKTKYHKQSTSQNLEFPLLKELWAESHRFVSFALSEGRDRLNENQTGSVHIQQPITKDRRAHHSRTRSHSSICTSKPGGPWAQVLTCSVLSCVISVVLPAVDLTHAIWHCFRQDPWTPWETAWTRGCLKPVVMGDASICSFWGLDQKDQSDKFILAFFVDH